MAQNKSIDLILLICVFAVSAVAGWFLSDLVMGKPVVVEPEPVVETEYVQEDTVVVEEDSTVFETEEVVEEEAIVPEVIEEPKPIVYEAFSSAQMEALINGGDYEARPADSKKIFKAFGRNIVVHNLKEGDDAPQDISQLCSKVADGFWKGVTGTVVIANDQNIITRVETYAVYPEE